MRVWSGLLVFSMVVGSSLVLHAAEPSRKKGTDKAAKAATGGPTSYERDIAPLMKKYCGSCHGAAQQIGGIGFHGYKDEAAVIKGRSIWEKAAQSMHGKHMPPKNMPQPTDAERALVVGWIEAKLSQADCDLDDPGRVTMRRLNRVEYNNTVRDLLGVQFRPGDDFPSDDVGYGFDNIGDVLTISPILMEKYLAAAEKITESAIVLPDPPVRRYEAERIPETGGAGVVAGNRRLLVSTGEVFVDHTFPKDGEYLIRARAFEERAGDERAKMAFRMDGKDLETVDVAATEATPQVYEKRVTVQAGKRRFAVAFTNDFYDQRSRDSKNRDRNLGVDYLEIAGPMNAMLDLPQSHQQLFAGVTVTKENAKDSARTIVSRLARRAYRRPATKDEVERLIRYVDMAQKEGESFERGIQLATQAILVSPHFLFRVELDAKPNDPKATRRLNDFELASRLSYFLWSSMPDEELLKVAEQGKLQDDKVLEAQTRRMLLDPRSQALVENFGSQWLTLRNLKNVSPDPKQFPQFDEDLRTAMLQETELFFASIVREDRSALDLLDAKYTFLNERLAKHYGIDWVKGDNFRKVVLQGDRRGGVLTHASILTITSNPTRTSPVKRGKWVLEQILGTPPPPPPPDVPELEEPKDVMLTGTLRQRMQQHMEDPTCASCHSRMDPIGFGMENFDPIGAWREKEGQFDVDASGTLPDGGTFNGPAQLVQVLKKQKKQFGKSFTRFMMTYALGRGLEHYDRCVVDEMVTGLDRENYKFSSIVTKIVKSDPFRMRRGDGGDQ